MWLSRQVRLFPPMMVRDKPLDTFHLLHLRVGSAVRAGSSSATSRIHRTPPYRAVLCSFWPRATVSGHSYTPLRPLCSCFCLLVVAPPRDGVVSAVGGLGCLVLVMLLPLLPVCVSSRPPAQVYVSNSQTVGPQVITVAPAIHLVPHCIQTRHRPISRDRPAAGGFTQGRRARHDDTHVQQSKWNPPPPTPPKPH